MLQEWGRGCVWLTGLIETLPCFDSPWNRSWDLQEILRYQSGPGYEDGKN